MPITPIPTFSFYLSKTQAAFLAFVVAAIVFFVYRIHLFPLSELGALWTVYIGPVSFVDVGFFFSEERSSGYRPLSHYLQDNVAYLYRQNGSLYHPYVVFVVSLLHGLLSLLIFGICHHQTRRIGISLAASFLYIFSLTAIVATWQNLFAAFWMAPHLAILGMIFSYLKFRTGRDLERWFWLVLFVILGLVGPWFREWAFLGSAVVLVVELVRVPKTRSLFPLIPALLFGHAIAPKALAALLGLYDGPIDLMIEGVGIKQNVNYSINGALQRHLFREDAAGIIISEIPPLLWAILLPVIAWSASQSLPKVFSGAFWNNLIEHQPLIASRHNENTKRPGLLIAAIIGVTVFSLNLYLIHPIFRFDIATDATKLSGVIFGGVTLERLLPLLFFVSLAFFATVRFGLLFPIWLLATLPPMIFLPWQMLSWTMIPLAAICALYIWELFQILSRIPIIKIKKLIYTFCYLALALVAMDHLGNVPSSFIALKNVTAGHKMIANWIDHNVPKGSIFFADFGPARDTVILGDQPSLNYANQPMDYLIVTGPAEAPQLELIQKAIKENRDVYYMNLASYSRDVRIPYPINAIKEVASFQINNLMFELDPLRHFIDNTQYRRTLIYAEWSNSYHWVGLGADPLIWKAAIHIYKLDMSKAATLTQSSFFYLKRGVDSPWPNQSPREAGQIKDLENRVSK